MYYGLMGLLTQHRMGWEWNGLRGSSARLGLFGLLTVHADVAAVIRG